MGPIMAQVLAPIHCPSNHPASPHSLQRQTAITRSFRVVRISFRAPQRQRESANCPLPPSPLSFHIPPSPDEMVTGTLLHQEINCNIFGIDLQKKAEARLREFRLADSSGNFF